MTRTRLSRRLNRARDLDLNESKTRYERRLNPDNDDDDLADIKTPITSQRSPVASTSPPNEAASDSDDESSPNSTATFLFSITTSIIIATAVALALYFTAPAIPVLGLILGGFAAAIVLTFTINAIAKYTMNNHTDYSIGDLRPESPSCLPRVSCTSTILLKLRNFFTDKYSYDPKQHREGKERQKRQLFDDDYVDEDNLTHVLASLGDNPASSQTKYGSLSDSDDDDLLLKLKK